LLLPFNGEVSDSDGTNLTEKGGEKCPLLSSHPNKIYDSTTYIIVLKAIYLLSSWSPIK
jgi:hypothetical protein